MLAACAMPEPPGELVGDYHIEGALTENECGDEALPAADPLSFDVQIRRDGKAGYWLQGMPPARPGQIGGDGFFSFELRQIYDVPTNGAAVDEPYTSSDPEELADPERFDKLDAARNGACRLTITETVEGSVLRDSEELDAEDDGEDRGPDLVGDNVIAISKEAGSQCERVMREAGGPFEQLPCKAHYDLTGQLLGEE